MRKLKIHFFVQSVNIVGTYFRFHNLAIGLIKRGHEVIVFGCDNDPKNIYHEEFRDGVPYRIWPGSKGQTYFGQWNHPKVVAERYFAKPEACDVAHLFQPFYSGAAPWLRLRKKGMTGLLVYDWDDLWEGGLGGALPQNLVMRFWEPILRNNIERHYPKTADVTTCCSEFLCQYARDRGAGVVEKIYNGFWPYERPDKIEARKSLNLRADAIYAGFMGRTMSGVPWIIRAFENVLPKAPALRLAICGMPDGIIGDLPSSIRDRVDNLGVLSPLVAKRFSAALDVGLLPLENTLFNQSRFPIKFAEYMACGTPIIASTVGECAVIGADMDWVVKAGKDEHSWTTAFLHWSLSPEKIAPVNEQKIAEVLHWDGIVRRLEDLYYQNLRRDTNQTNNAIT
ncbi:MAG TPA: glycosyltransferase family 4 protein [Cyclobacteriaceae bacterium]|nr:glycosyltransferase family 4 protein [Cyclobacteriaceae bacterium]